MVPKKNQQKDLENRRIQHFKVSMVVALSIVLISLEWSSNPEKAEMLAGISNDYEPDIIRQIPREKPKKKRIQLPEILTPVPAEDLDDVVDIEKLINFDTEYKGEGIDYVFDLNDDPEQINEEPVNNHFISQPARFPGGEEAMMKQIYSMISYPQEAIENGIEGRVIARFTVNSRGEVEDIRIEGAVHPSVDNEVIRILQSLPLFEPAMQNGRRVPVFMYIPVVFDLQ